MSQERRTNKTALQAPDDLPLTEHWSADAYADRLMNELFEDVEHTLDGTLNLPDEPLQPEPPATPLNSPLFNFPSTLMFRREESNLETAPGESPIASAGDRAIAERQKAAQTSNRLLLLAGCTSLVLAAGVWFALNQESVRSWGRSLTGQSAVTTTATAPAPPAVAPLTKAEADAQFTQYMQRSLKLIESESASSPSQKPVTPPGPVPTLQIPAASAPLDAAATRDLTQALNRVAALLERTANAPNRLLPPTIPYPANAPAPAPSAPAPSAPVAAAPVVPAQPAVPAVPHTLVGLLQLGERSAALFEVNGVTRRVYIGESIGSSGWALVEVGGQEAVVRRNGEVRSIYIGQQF